MKRLISMLLAVILLLSLLPAAAAQEGTAEQSDTALIDGTTQWSYLDNNTDPAAGAADRTVWTAEDFELTDDWKTAAGPFGSKNGAAYLESGYTAKTVLAGCTGSGDYPAYFFRARFTVDSLEGMTRLDATVQHDDGVIVYINGVRVAAFEDLATDSAGNSLDKPFDANLQYGGATLGTPRTSTVLLTDLSILHEGENTVAVEIHQRSADSSDIWFDMPQMTLSNEAVPSDHNDIVLTPGADESQMQFSWYFPDEEAGYVQLCPEAELQGNAMPEDAPVFAAESAPANDGQYYYHAVAVGLKPGTAYVYRLVNGTDAAGLHTFTTAETGDFTFAFVGDPQVGISLQSDTVGWGNTLSRIENHGAFENAAFLLTAGDHVQWGHREDFYDALLQSPVMRGLPLAPAVGNHDNNTYGRGDDTKVNAFSQHFYYPNRSQSYGVTTAGSDYWFTFNNVLFIMLNTNDLSTAEHRAFMEEAIEANPNAAWKIVVFHHSLYSVAAHSSDSDILSRRETLVPVLNELDIDVVLMGHDHSYCRTYIMDGLIPITDPAAYDDAAMTSATDPDGILFVTANTSSGSNVYNIANKTFAYSAVQNQERIPNVSRVAITNRSFTITTYRTTDMSVVDTFTINRTSYAADVVDQIDAIGDVTADSIQTIAQARQAYDALTEKDRASVYNYQTLLEAEEALKLLLAQSAAEAAEMAQAAAEEALASAEAARIAADEAGTMTAQDMSAAQQAEQMALEAAAKAQSAQNAAQEAKAAAEAVMGADSTLAAKDAEQESRAAADAAISAADAAASAAAAAEACRKAQETLAAAEQETKLRQAKTEAQKELERYAASIDATTAEEEERIRQITVEAREAIEAATTVQQAEEALADAKTRMDDADCPSEGYSDISEDAWFHGAVDYVLENGLMSGDGDDTFDPNKPLTRAMLVQILYNMEGKPSYEGDSSFTDVAEGRWYYDAVTWAAQKGIVSGYENGAFGPDDLVTREQMVAIFWRYSGAPKLKVYKIKFDDAALVADYAKRAVIWATETGIVSGVGGNLFDPDGSSTRAQAAQVMKNFCELAE